MTSGNSGIAQAPLSLAPAATHHLGPHQGDEPIEVTVVLRRRDGAPTAASWPHPPAATHQNFPALCGAHPTDITDAAGAVDPSSFADLLSSIRL